MNGRWAAFPGEASAPHDEASEAHAPSQSHRGVPEIQGGQLPVGGEQTFKQWILTEALSMGRAMGGGMGAVGGTPRDPSAALDPFFCFAHELPRPRTQQSPWIPEKQVEGAKRPQQHPSASQAPSALAQATAGRSPPPASARTPPGSGRAPSATAGPGSGRANGVVEGSGQPPTAVSRGSSTLSFADEMSLLPFSGAATPHYQHSNGSPPESPGDSAPGGSTRVLRFDHSKPNRDVGVGAHFEKVVGGSEVRVVRMTERGPAQRSGEVRIGDILLSVNDAQVNGKPMCDLAKLVLGAEGSRVKLELLRGPAKQRFSVVLTRARVES